MIPNFFCQYFRISAAFIVLYFCLTLNAYAGYDYKIVTLLPLSGANSAKGVSLLQAMHLAAKDMKKPDMKIIAIDSEKKAEDIVYEILLNKPDVIIGPVYSADMKKLESYIQVINTCFVSLSNDESLKNRDCLFLMGVMPQDPARAMVQYLAQDEYKFYAFLPKNHYGNILAKSLKKMNEDKEINLVDMKFYEPSKQEEIMQEARSLNDQMHVQSGKIALLIPDNSILKTMASVINHNKIQLIGTAQWENPALYNNLFLQGSLFPSPPSEHRMKFEERYVRAFEDKPIKTSSIAYDSILLIESIYAEKESGRLDKEDFLTDEGFYGVTGLFKFNQDGSNIREMSIFKIQDGQAIEISKNEL